MSDIQDPAADIFIVDNSSDETQVLAYLRQWCEISSKIDIATGHFEIGSLLALDGDWQRVDAIRILIGGETSRSTQEVIARACAQLEESFDSARKDDVFLEGIDAIVDAIRSGRIEVKVYGSRKFHAKAYITHGRLSAVGSAALVGSSNFTRPGLTRNIELNLRIGGAEVRDLQIWFERYWREARPVTPELLTVLEKQTRVFTPFEVYARSLQVLTENVRPLDREWEEGGAAQGGSVMYPILSPYQQEAYHALRTMAARQRGGFLTDGVGLGKTFVGLMLAEYYAVRERRNVLIMATKTGQNAVWEPDIQRYLPSLKGTFSPLLVAAHTDLTGVGTDELTRDLAKKVDVVIIDEAHNFRNRGKAATEDDPNRSRWFRLQEICAGKIVFHLTATPINNSLLDLLHQIQLFAGDDDAYFQEQMGIPSLRQEFGQLESQFLRAALHEDATRQGQAQITAPRVSMEDFKELMTEHRLLRALVHQNSRKYAIESARRAGHGEVIFPETAMPRAINYGMTLEASALLSVLDEAFKKTNPLFALPMYYPLAYWTGDQDVDTKKENRQRQVVSLIRTVFLKRFESSIAAFAGSCVDLTAKILEWIERYGSDDNRTQLDQWRDANRGLLEAIEEEILRRPDGLQDAFLATAERGEDFTLEDTQDEELDEIDALDPRDYDIPLMVALSFEDLDQLLTLLEAVRVVGVDGDDKYKHLAGLLGARVVPGLDKTIYSRAFREQKVLLFTEFADTARYLERRLIDDGLDGVVRLDGSMSRDRTSVIRRFAPFYNRVPEDQLFMESDIRVLVSTDVLSEGVNLQDGTLLINYDLHWNPVRLMQRMGRVDRRRDRDTEQAILAFTGLRESDRRNVEIRNFLPGDQLERLLGLYKRAGNRARLISATLGIPGGRLFDEADMLDDVKVFDSLKTERDGNLSELEELRLIYLDLCAAEPALDERLRKLPRRIGVVRRGDRQGIFLCRRVPSLVVSSEESFAVWSNDPGEIEWCYQLADGATLEAMNDYRAIEQIIRAVPSDASVPVADRSSTRKRLSAVNKTLDNVFVQRTGLPLDAPDPELVCWMEIV